MLPGFRFLFAAIVLSMSIMVFGVGAASLFRAAHEEFASNPSWRPSPETSFTQQSEATGSIALKFEITDDRDRRIATAKTLHKVLKP